MFQVLRALKHSPSVIIETGAIIIGVATGCPSVLWLTGVAVTLAATGCPLEIELSVQSLAVWLESQEKTYSVNWVTCLLAIDEVLTFWTAIPKLPVKVGMHPGGAEPDAEMAAVTPCGNGEALTAATAARRARAYCILGRVM